MPRRYRQASAASSEYRNSRFGEPVPQTTTSPAPFARASCILRIIARIDARRTQEQQAFDPRAPGLVNHVALDLEIFAEKVRGISVVGDDAADPGRRQKNVIGPLALEKLAHRSLFRELEFGVGAGDEIAISCSLQTPHERRANQATMARNVDFGVRFHFGNGEWGMGNGMGNREWGMGNGKKK